MALSLRPALRHDPRDPLVPWQWRDGAVYLCGFKDEGTARTYGQARGWTA